MTIQEKYEEICQFINWSNTINDDKTKLALMQKYSSDEIEMVVEFAVDLIDQLETAIEKYENTDGLKLNVGSDDGMQDVLAEIISMGVDVVEKYIKNPKLIEQKYESDDYTENFLNCFPDKDDYDKMNLEYYQVLSKDMIAMAELKGVGKDVKDKFETVLAEFTFGEFKKEYSYDELYELGKKVDIGAYIANTWKAGSNFYSPKSIT
jgi:hypothetical protein